MQKYEDLGYTWTNQGDEFTVKVHELSPYSKVIVLVQCDYCGKKVEKLYFKWLNGRRIQDKDACDECKLIKTKESLLLKHGVDNPNLVEGASERGAKNQIVYSYDFVKSEFEKRGYILVSKEYGGMHSELEYICPFHEDKGIQSKSFQQLYYHGTGCRFCGYEKNSGENNVNWNGGKSDVNQYLRQHLNYWRRESFVSTGFRCDITGINSSDLEVHHIIPLNRIIKDSHLELKIQTRKKISEYPEQELRKLLGRVTSKHSELLGIPLQKDVHALFHKIYGKIDFGVEEYIYFKENYNNLMEEFNNGSSHSRMA